MFRVGQKVVCIDDGDCACGCRHAGPSGLQRGMIYTLTWISAEPDSAGNFGCTVAEAVCPKVDGHHDAYALKRFRPAVERKTDIAIFKKLLAPSNKRATETAS